MTNFLRACISFALAGTVCLAHAEAKTSFNPHALPVPAALSVQGKSTAPPENVSELKFGEIFKLPIGPKGLETSERLRSLNGQQVRMVGFMAARESATPGQFILSPIPVLMGDEDESFADDLPPSAVFVHLPPALREETVLNLHGLMQIEGTLRVGAQEENDGRVSAVRIELNDATSRWLPLAPRITAKR